MQSLEGAWRLATDPENLGRERHWFDFIPQEAREAPVPGIIQQVFPGYHGLAWYWRTLHLRRPVPTNGRCLLCFGAVDYLAEVWVNGVFIGGHEGGETPFTLDVTGALRPEDDNLLTVRVLNPTDEPIEGIRLAETPHRNKEVANYQPGRSYNYGGILLPVELLIVPAVRVTDIFARPDVASGSLRVTTTVRNDEPTTAEGQLVASVSPANISLALNTNACEASFAPGDSAHELTLKILQPRLWSLDDPYLYRVVATLEATDAGVTYRHVSAVRCGFRDFRVVNGYFRLNGKRIFLRSTHTGNHYPIGQVVPHNPDFLRRDLIYAKASGFNMVRFISGVAYPEQLDFCDEIGLMVYEESLAGWCLADSPQRAKRYDLSVHEMVLRDRNHPSVTIWGMLNETPDGPVFRHAVEALSLVRSLDDTRLVLLNSGRWDHQPGIGSLCNPGSTEWEHEWGAEAPNAPAVLDEQYPPDQVRPGGYVHQAGDAHVYPVTPQPAEVNAFIRTLGANTKPVFLSEYGIGSLFNAIQELRGFEQVGARLELDDVSLIRSMVEKLEADWKRFGMDGVYPFPEDMLRDSQRLHARQRLLGFDLIRANPNLCGFNLTGMLDHAITGEGLWTFWRQWKPGIVDVLVDGWAPLRWCLFANPLHGYIGQPIKLEAVLANEDVLPPGEYPVCFRVMGPEGLALERRTVLRLPEPDAGDYSPLAVPALCEEIVFGGPAGVYQFAAGLERGGAPAGGRLQFRLADPMALPHVKGTITLWGIEKRVESWLASHGVRCRQYRKSAPRTREVLLVGNPGGDLAQWTELARRMARGSTVLFLSPKAFRHGDDLLHWLPLAKKGRCYEFGDWLYHKECVAKSPPVFEGLQGQGIMDWDYYDQVIPHYLFDGQDTPEEVAAAAFAVGYCCPGGYASGVLVGSYSFGSGRFVLNTLRVLENLDVSPPAGRLLLNFLRDATHGLGQPLAPLPDDFDAQLSALAYC